MIAGIFLRFVSNDFAQEEYCKDVRYCHESVQEVCDIPYEVQLND